MQSIIVRGSNLKSLFSMDSVLKLALSFSLLATLGCSTPPVPDNTTSYASEAAWREYDRCVRQLTPVNRAHECNSIRVNGLAVSYTEYVYGDDSADQIKPMMKHADSAYHDYLASLDSSVLSQMQHQWQSLTEVEAGADAQATTY